jgi:hypothetical protein
MRFAGQTHQFLGDVLPSDFRAKIFSLTEDRHFPHVPACDPLMQLSFVGFALHTIHGKGGG